MPHIHFDEEDADAAMDEAPPEAAAPAPQASTSGRKETYAGAGPAMMVPSRTIYTTLGKVEDPDYVFDICTNHEQSAMAASLSTHIVKVYHPASGDFLGQFQGHTDTIHELGFPEPASPHFLVSCSSDGTVREWDLRSFSQVGQYACGPGHELESFSFGGPGENMVAGAGREVVLLWDRRTHAGMGAFEESHMEQVTQVRFHPIHPNKLLSSSVDGLVCVFETGGTLDDEDCMETVLPVNTSVSSFGFYGPQAENVWCLTNIETMSLWNWAEGAQLADFPETRELASRQWQGPPIDYLIQCEYDPSTSQLDLVAGTQDGAVGVFTVDQSNRCSDAAVPRGSLRPAKEVYHGAHESVVRAFCRIREGQSSGLIWTGGEDRKMVGWARGPGDVRPQPAGSSDLVMRTSGPSRRHSPY
ncbi:WD40 repeat protein [Klebsormidium nitens]|uniref:WD40 repeat protein n=1 Tax=Klebsormidium nitens TaxID=105231 RepID=A0A1Y1I4H2_KLENI|nr:WD40 repeat protein [Klebsormidium nitens]|eukprot:GAQ83008.1 WD40 repeat protein [Klebsormidium nitens]